MSSKRQERPLRASSYQGSYIELPFRDTDDDAYDGRIFFGPYTSAAKNQKNSSIAREMVSNSQKAEEGKNDDCVADDAKRDTRQTHFLKSCASYTFEESDEEKASSSMEDIPKLIKAEPMDIDTVGGPSSASGSSTRSSNEELIPNLMEIDGDENSKFDNDKAMMPPPPLPWGKLLKPTKVAEKKKEVVKKPEAKDWNARLTSMYGSVENAKAKPWLSDDQSAALNQIGPNSKMIKRYSIQNWDAEPVDDDTDIHEISPLFQFPKDDGLDREISKKLQFVRDSINLYRTLHLQNANNDRVERPLFLPFLRRNLRYNNYVPSDGKRASSTPMRETPDASASTPSETHEDASHDNVDLAVKLLSIKNNILPAGYKASVTFYYSLFKYNTHSFTKVFKVESSTVTVDVNAEYPKNIDLPPELEYNPDDPYEVFVVLRTIFYDPSKDVYAAGKSLRNVPARVRGKCERAREEEESKGGKPREAKEEDIVMFGAIQITKKYREKWTYSTGSTSLILVEADRLEIENSNRRWQLDTNLIPKVLALARKHHGNPFVYIELNNGEEDDNSIASTSSKKSKKIRQNEVKSPVPEKLSKYDLPIAIVYQLSLDFMYKDDDESQPQQVTTGFTTIVTNNYTNLDTQQIMRPKSKATLKKHCDSESKPLSPELVAALATMDEKAPPPRIFTYYASRSSGYCIFCEIENKNLFSLMCHYRTCHSRFTYVYRSAIEYRRGHYLPGFVLTPSSIDEDLYWHQRKQFFNVYKKAWPQKYNIDNSFITPCNSLFQGVTDGLQDIVPLRSIKHRFNRYGSRPINYQHTGYGRLVKPIPDWWAVKMRRDLNDIVDLDPLEITFMDLWNNFLYLNGPISGKETNAYKLCRSFVETRRQEIVERHLEIPTLTLVAHFVENKVLTSDEMYDISMRMQTNYDPFTDILHPLTINERRRAQRHIHKQEAQAERLKRKRPKKVYEPSSISLRCRLASAEDDKSRSGSVNTFDDDTASSSLTGSVDSPSIQQDQEMSDCGES